MSKRGILFCDIFPEIPASACTHFCIAVWGMVLVTVNGTLCTASVCDKYKVVFREKNAFFFSIYFTFDGRGDFFAVLEFKDNICDFCVETEVNTCRFQIFLHWKNQRFILIIFCEFQSAEIRKACNMMNKALEVKLHLKSAVPVFESEHSSPVQPEGGVKYFVIENVLDCFVVKIFVFCEEKLHDFHAALLT